MKSNLIDPHLDQIPADNLPLTEEERLESLSATPVTGLSINDTIAHHANVSIGSTGVSTSTIPTGVVEDEPTPATPTVDTESEE